MPKIPGGGQLQLGMAKFFHPKNGRFIEKEKEMGLLNRRKVVHKWSGVVIWKSWAKFFQNVA